MFKINLHAHTTNSDGGNSILEMAARAKDLGHSSLVITDHDSSGIYSYQSCIKELEVLKKNNLIDFPVIIGSEIMTPFGEFLLFGEKALKSWQHYKHRLKYISDTMDHTLWVEVFKSRVLSDVLYSSWNGLTTASHKGENSYALVMCHPRVEPYFIEHIPLELWPLVHGFEVVNGVEDLSFSRPETIKKLRWLMPWAVELKNSDAHHANELTESWNEIDKDIKEENDLIQWLQSGRKKWIRFLNGHEV